MLVIDDDPLYSLQWDVDDVVNFVKTLVGCCLAASLFQIESEVRDAPLAAMLLVIVLWVLLDGIISQVNLHVIQLCYIRCVLLVTESAKPLGVQPHFQRPVACNQYIYSQIKLLPSNQQWIFNVPRYHICFLQRQCLKWQFGGCCPLFELIELVDQEYTLALSFWWRFHDPHLVGIPPELIHEYLIVTR